MKNEETNKTVEATLIELNEQVEEIDREAEEHSNKLAKIKVSYYCTQKFITCSLFIE